MFGSVVVFEQMDKVTFTELMLDISPLQTLSRRVKQDLFQLGGAV